MENPWITIWTRPRATIAQIVSENPKRSLWTLSAIYGFCSLMNIFQSIALGTAMQTGGIVILAALLAPFWGYANISVWSAVVGWVGKLLKGKGTFQAVRAAYAWSCVPIAINVPLWLLMAVWFGHQLFLNFPDAHLLPQQTVLLLFAIFVVKVVLAIWSFIIYLNALAEVQAMGIFRTIVNVIGALIVFIGVFGLLWGLLLHAMK